MNDFISLYGLPRTAPMTRVFRKKKVARPADGTVIFTIYLVIYNTSGTPCMQS